MARVPHIIEQAHATVVAANVSGRYPVPLESIANHLGYDIFKFTSSDPADSDVSGFIIHEGEDKGIYLNGKTSANRQMFTLAHEIGHAVLHRNEGDLVDVIHHRGKTRSPIENEADQFAGELLMPEHEYRRVWARFDGYLPLVASHFAVSIEAANVRQNVLGII